MQVIECEQRSAQWYNARAGKPTASQFHRIMTPKNRALSASHVDYISEMIAEKLFGVPLHDEKLDDVHWIKYGREHEPHAVRQFHLLRGLITKPIGFVLSDCGRYGCSPDRIVNAFEGVEIKCPAPQTLVSYWLHGLKENYTVQIQGQMLICGFQRVHFYAYRHDMPAWHKVVERDEACIEALRVHIETVCDKLEEEWQRAQELGLYAIGSGK
jgi:hypothetical protein